MHAIASTEQAPGMPGIIECRDPATQEYLGQVKVLSRPEVVERVRRARVAQEAWAPW